MLNHSVMNKKYGDQIKKKTVDKEKWIITCQPITPVNGLLQNN